MASISGFRIFVHQTRALTKKNLLIAVVKHPVSTCFRALIVPIAFMVLLSNLKNFLITQNGFGIGSPQPVQNLTSNILSTQKLVVVQPNDLGPDVGEVVRRLTDPLRNHQVVVLSNPTDLLTTCKESIQGASDCFAAVVFNDSPLTIGKSGIWNYTIRTDSKLSGGSFFANTHSTDEQRVNLPWQVAIDNAITNSSIIPNEYLYTSISQATQNDDIRKTYQGLIISTYGIAFFIGTVSSIYHLVGMITTERESGMTQLIDAMGGLAAARICGYVLAFDLIYLPSWIIVGIVFWDEVFRTSSVLISLFWQVFTGMALTSASVFAAMFFNRAQLSGVYTVIGFLVTALVGQIVDSRSHSVGVVAVLGLLFPSMNYMFMLGYLGRYERQNLHTNMLHAPQSAPGLIIPPSVSGVLLWVFLWIQIILYPIAAVYVERIIHGANSKNRTIEQQSTQDGNSIEIRGIAKIYPPSFRQRWLSFKKTFEVIAVQDLDLTAKKGQILCLLGANGSGKTTTLDMIGGLQKLTSGSIKVNAAISQLGICPQQNVLWEELTVFEHLKIWNDIKYSQDENLTLEQLIDACDLTTKKFAKSGTLSGGQKRKLQLACMFVGGSTVCLLDEVSSGLDPLSRRMIWNIILAERNKRSMILTTHFLDEADVLADHIAIISLGELKCEGSAVELKTQLGGGYRVHLPGTSNGPNMPFKTTHLPDQTVYTIPNSESAAKVLSNLASAGHTEVFVNGPTVEDVFLRVAQDAGIQATPFNAEPEEITSREEPFSQPEAFGTDEMKLSSGEDLSLIRQAQVLFHKRFTIILRSWIPHAFALLIPIAATPALKTFVATYTPPMCSSLAYKNFNKAQPLNILYAAQQIGDLQILAGPASINQTLFDVVSRFPVGLGLPLYNYTNQFVFKDSLSSYQDDIAANFTNITPGAIYMGSNTTAPTYAFVGDYGILPAMVIQNLWTQLNSGLPIAAYYAPFDSFVNSLGGNSPYQYIAYFCLVQAVYPAFFTLYPTLERLRNVRALQYSNGVRPPSMWLSYVLFDSAFVLLIAAVCTIAVSQEAHWWFAVGNLFPVLALYGIVSVIYVYILSLFASSQLAAFAFAAGSQAIMFLISLVVFNVVETFTSASRLQLVLDATTFGLNIIFPIGNVVRALIVGFNFNNVNCRNDHYISIASSIYAYGGPIIYLIVQTIFLFFLLLWLEGVHLPAFLRGRQTIETDIEHELHPVAKDVEDEKKRVDASDSETDLLRVLQLTKRFGSNVAVDNISFGIGPGIFALLGPNGAGKSTTINMIRGEVDPDHGTVLVEGKNILTDIRAARKLLGVCPQFDALDLLTTREHLEFYARAKGIATTAQDVDIVIRKVDLTGYEDRLASKLSGGNKRKLSLAIALLGNPRVLVLDEPSSSMDAASKRAMWKILLEVTAGRSILLTTHSMEEADALATRAAIISKRILAIGSTDFLRKKYGDVYHVHIVLESAPLSSAEEMKHVEEWAQRTFTGVKFDAFGSYHGQIKFSVPAVHGEAPGSDAVEEEEIQPMSEGLGEGSLKAEVRKGGVSALFQMLEENKGKMGLKFYSVGATTLDQVFLNVVTENNVLEEGYTATHPKKARLGWFS